MFYMLLLSMRPGLVVQVKFTDVTIPYRLIFTFYDESFQQFMTIDKKQVGHFKITQSYLLTSDDACRHCNGCFKYHGLAQIRYKFYHFASRKVITLKCHNDLLRINSMCTVEKLPCVL